MCCYCGCLLYFGWVIDASVCFAVLMLCGFIRIDYLLLHCSFCDWLLLWLYIGFGGLVGLVLLYCS